MLMLYNCVLKDIMDLAKSVGVVSLARHPRAVKSTREPPHVSSAYNMAIPFVS